MEQHFEGATYLRTLCSPRTEREQLRGLCTSIDLQLGKGSCVALNRLADTSFTTVQLDVALDLEGGRVGGVPRDADQDQPLLVRCRAVVDNLCADKSRMTVEDLLRRGCCVRNCPMVHRGLSDHAQGRVVDPLPKNDILCVDMGFDLLLGLHVEDLERTAS